MGDRSDTWHAKKNLKMSNASVKQNIPNGNSRSPLKLTLKNTSNGGNENPATFVCEGIEVDFDSSDSEDEVQPLTVLKVLKKTDNVGGGNKLVYSGTGAVLPGERDTACRKPKILQRSFNGQQGRSNQINGPSKNDHDGGAVQTSVPRSSPVLVTSPGPSYVVLSGLRRRPLGNGGASTSMSNCTIIKRPRPLLSQPVRPLMRQLPIATPTIDEKCVGVTPEEARIIEDVLDMMEEVERRKRFALLF